MTHAVAVVVELLQLADQSEVGLNVRLVLPFYLPLAHDTFERGRRHRDPKLQSALPEAQRYVAELPRAMEGTRSRDA